MAIHTVVAYSTSTAMQRAQSAISKQPAFPSSDINLIANNAGNRYEELAESWRQAGWRGFDERADPYAMTDAAAGVGPLPRTGAAPSSAPISGPTDAKPAWQAGAPASADEMLRDGEVRRDVSRVSEGAQQRTGVRTYPRTEEDVSDKR